MQVLGLAPEGTVQLSEVPYPAEGRVLVIGSEGNGLRRLVREQCDALARIELHGPMQSLNAAVAAGIAIYESVRQR
jgi:23S rRNA (guanosine2251-2'-O)-methyltransferase